VIVVNPATRQFNIPGADLVFGVTADANSSIKHFQCPRCVGNNVDIASSFVRINYQNPQGEIDFYLVKDVTIDGDNVTFSWELHPKVTMYKGNVSFVMCVTGPDGKVKWHTTLGRGQVLEGLEPDNALVEGETKDGIAALIAMVDAQTEAVADTGAEWVRNVQFEGTDQIIAVQTAGAEAKAAAVAEIEAKGVNVRESIPGDYTSLGNAVDSLVRGRAGAIVCEAEGSVIAVKDASDNYLQGLRIFGRSTQDGIPTPDAPVEIKSVENPVVTVAGKNLAHGTANQEHDVGGVIMRKFRDKSEVSLNGTATKLVSYPIMYTDVLPAGVYTTSVYGLNSISSTTDRIYVVDDDTQKVLYNNIMDNAPKTFVIEKETSIRIDVVFAEGSIYENRIVQIQIEPGSVATAYEPYKAAQTVKTTHPLRGIPVTSGGNYTDENGQQWICDEVDLERGVYVQRIYEQTILANKITTIDTSFLEFGAYCSVISDVPMLVDTRIKLTMSDFALGVPTDDRNRPEHTPWYRTYHSGGSGFVIRYPASVGMKTIEEARVDFAGKKIRYVLATPVETPLSETEIAAYRALHTNKPNTTILNDSGAHMKVKYAADTKLYIDNKLAALVGNT
jgi:hypothetical protein